MSETEAAAPDALGGAPGLARQAELLALASQLESVERWHEWRRPHFVI
jgi:hypothetical protein